MTEFRPPEAAAIKLHPAPLHVPAHPDGPGGRALARSDAALPRRLGLVRANGPGGEEVRARGQGPLRVPPAPPLEDEHPRVEGQALGMAEDLPQEPDQLPAAALVR